MRSSSYILLILMAAALWGTTGTAQTFAPTTASPVVLGAIRLAVGGLALFVYVLLRGAIKNFKGLKIIPTVIAAIGVASYQPLFFSAVSVTGVAVGTVVAIGSAPILAGFLEWGFMKRTPERKWWISTLLAVTGCMLLVMNDKSVSVNPFGVIMAIGAGLSFAVYTIFSKHLIKHHHPDAVVAVIFMLSALFLTPLFVVHDLTWLLDVNGMMVALHLGLFTTALAYILYTRGLTGVSSANAVTLSLAEPLTATFLGVVIVNEVLTTTSWAGVSLLFLGLGVLSYTPSQATQRNY